MYIVDRPILPVRVLQRGVARLRALPLRTRVRILYALPMLAGVGLFLVARVASAAGLTQPADDQVLNWVSSVLLVPGATVLVTAGLRFITNAVGLKPTTAVYAASYIVLGVALWMSGANLPTFDGNPHTYVMSWLTFATANAETARRYYEVIGGLLGFDKAPPTA